MGDEVSLAWVKVLRCRGLVCYVLISGLGFLCFHWDLQVVLSFMDRSNAGLQMWCDIAMQEIVTCILHIDIINQSSFLSICIEYGPYLRNKEM